MSRTTVWKYPLLMEGDVTVSAVEDFKPILVGTQFGVPTLWAEVDPESAPALKSLRLVPTGAPGVQPGDEYVGSLVLDGGNIVSHVYYAPAG